MSAVDRWSERKRRVAEAEAREKEAREEEASVGGDARARAVSDPGAAPFRPPADGTADPERIAALDANRHAAEAIDLDALRPGSNMSAFFREGVPEALRRRALTALWRSDPVFSNVDRLCDYDDDFRAASMVPGVIQSAWQAGRGYLFPEDEPKAEGAEPGGDATEGAEGAEATAMDSPGKPSPTVMAEVETDEPGTEGPPAAGDDAIPERPDGIELASVEREPVAAGEEPMGPSLRARLGL